jgi:hypothetical protein
MAATVAGSTFAVVGGTTAVSLARASAGAATTGDTVLVAVQAALTGVVPRCTNATFVPLFAPTTMGTRTVQVLARYVAAGDPTSYTFDLTGASASKLGHMVTIRGAPIAAQLDLLAHLRVGRVGTRAAGDGTTLTDIAPAVAADAGGLVLAASFEATTLDDTVGPTSSWTLVAWTDDPSVESIAWWRTIAAAAGSTAPLTVTYQNPQAANGAAVQVAVGADPWRPGVCKAWTGSTWAAKPMKVWNGSAWITKPTRATP